MKKLSLIVTVIMGLLLTANVKAQTKSDYFPGRWLITVIGTPQGDVKILLFLTEKMGN